jgi:hypothetical protein
MTYLFYIYIEVFFYVPTNINNQVMLFIFESLMLLFVSFQLVSKHIQFKKKLSNTNYDETNQPTNT